MGRPRDRCEPLRWQTCCWWFYTVSVKGFFFFFNLKSLAWNEQTVKQTIYKRCNFIMITHPTPSHSRLYMGGEISPHLSSSSAHNTQWLKKKTKVANVNTLMYNVTVLSYPRSVQGPVTLHWGPIKLVSKEFMGKNRWGMRKKIDCVHAWHCTRFITSSLSFNMYNPYRRKQSSHVLGFPTEDTSLAGAQAKFGGK